MTGKRSLEKEETTTFSLPLQGGSVKRALLKFSGVHFPEASFELKIYHHPDVDHGQREEAGMYYAYGLGKTNRDKSPAFQAREHIQNYNDPITIQIDVTDAVLSQMQEKRPLIQFSYELSDRQKPVSLDVFAFDNISLVID